MQREKAIHMRFQLLLQYLIVLLFVTAVLNAIILIQLTDRAMQQTPALPPDRLIGQLIGEVTMVIMVCGDGLVHGNESCDGNATNGSTCASLGYGGGTLSCKTNCSYNTSACTSGDSAGPIIDLQYPMNNSNFTWRDLSFWYNATDASSGIGKCELFLDGEKEKSKDNVNETISQSFNVQGVGSGNHTWQVNCTDDSTAKNVGSSAVWKFRVTVNSSDYDGDGIDDSNDHFIGTNASVNTSTLGNPVIYIGNSANFLSNFSGNLTVNITDGRMEIMSFTFNFDAATLNFSRLRFEQENRTMNFSQFEIGHLELPPGVTKAVFMNKVDAAISSVCVRDTADATAADITESCTGSGETFLTCNGNTAGGYSCTEVDGRFRIAGLQHSAGKQQAQASGGTGTDGERGKIKRPPSGPPVAPSPPAQKIAAARPSTTPQPAAPFKSNLFDVEIRVVHKFKEVLGGEEVVGEIALFYLGDERLQKAVDISVYYAILDARGGIIAEKLETVGVQTRATIVGKLGIPLGMAPGPYWFYSRIEVGKEIAEAFDTFTVLQQPVVEQPELIVPQQYLIVIIFLLSVMLLIIAHHQYLLEQHLAQHHGKLSEEDLLRLQMLIKQKER